MRARGVAVAAAALLGAAPGAQARVGPGVQVLFEGSQCTSNFVFRDATDLYLGTAAHCAQAGEGNGIREVECVGGAEPLGTPATIEGASRPGTIAYSSWLAMIAHGETDLETCANNDFMLVRVDPADHAKVDPSVPGYGGPIGLRRAPLQSSESVVSYGRSDLHAGVEPLQPREGYVMSSTQTGWEHTMRFVTPAVWGDSGSAVLDGAGGALGVLVHLGDGVTDLARALDYMRSHGGPDARLVDGRAPFTGSGLPELLKSPPSPSEPPPDPPAPAPTPTPAPAPAPAPAAPPAADKPPAAKRAPQKRAAKKRRARCRRSGRKRTRCTRRPARRPTSARPS